MHELGHKFGHMQSNMALTQSEMGHTQTITFPMYKVRHTQSNMALTQSAIGHTQSAIGHMQSATSPRCNADYKTHELGILCSVGYMTREHGQVGHTQNNTALTQSATCHTQSVIGHTQSAIGPLRNADYKNHELFGYMTCEHGHSGNPHVQGRPHEARARPSWGPTMYEMDAKMSDTTTT